MRLLCAALWFVATLLWLPWAAALVRLGIELAVGTPGSQANWLRMAFIGPWPLYSWLHWGIVSWYPLVGLLGMALSAATWRLYWPENDFRLPPRWKLGLGIAVPPLSLGLLYFESRRRLERIDATLLAEAHAERDAGLARGAIDPRELHDATFQAPAPVSYRGFALLTAANFVLWGALGLTLIPWWGGLLGFLLVEFAVFIAPALLRRDLPEL